MAIKNNKGASPYDSGYIVHYPEGDYSLERNTPTIINSPSDKIHTLKEGETLQNIAYQQYGDSGKWYIIAEANQIGNPFRELKSGMKLRIPAYGLIE